MNDPLTHRPPPVRDPVSKPPTPEQVERGRHAARVLNRRRARLARASIIYRQWQAPAAPPSYMVRDLTIAVLAIVLGLVWLFSDPAPMPIAGW